MLRTSLIRSWSLLLMVGLLGAADADPEAVLADLRAADAARSTEADEAAAWARERERLELLLASLEQETDELEREAAELREGNQRLRDRARAPEAVAAEVAALEATIADLAATVRSGLHAAARELPPGVVPSSGEEPERSGDDALAAALADLRAAEQALARSEVAVVTAQRDERTVAVELLRLGGAGLWWCELDGEAAGPAEVVAGVVHCRPATDAASAAAIRRAIAIRKGHQPAELVRLPLPAPADAAAMPEATP